MSSYRGKRALDIAIAGPAWVMSLPVQAAIAVAIRVQMGRPILFRQTRPGLNGEPFQLVKFRSMLLADPASGLVTDEQRLTPLGRFLRSTSLDELPTLVNVLRGEMSVVGPRPLLMEYLGRYTAEQARRHRVRPGLTGLAQINGRNALSWPEKLRLDTQYVDRMSLIEDLRIIAVTVAMVVKREGISAPDSATMPPFHGGGEAA